MCQLAYIDFKKGYYPSPLFVKWLMTANCLEGHTDGFGFFLESGGAIYKSKLSAVNWFTENYYDTFCKLRNTNGIYHVRRASVKLLPPDIKDEHAHPFRLGNLVIAHNGTLELQNITNDPLVNKELFSDDLIDSQKFLIVISHYYAKNKNILTEEVIKDAISEFTGSFVFLIRDITTKNLFIVKDELKELSVATFYKGKEVVGNIWNTRYYMLDLLSEIYLDTHSDLECVISGIPKETIYKYTLGVLDSFERLVGIKNPVKRLKVIHDPIKTNNGIPQSVHIGTGNSLLLTKETEDNSIVNFFQTVLKCCLTLEDIFILYELIYEKSILSITEESVEKLKKLVEKIDITDWTEKRADALQTLSLYFTGSGSMSMIKSSATDLSQLSNNVFSYPLICNGKEKLESTALEIEELYK